MRTALASDVDHFGMRVLTDALQEGTRAYWLRRKQAFLEARPRIGDFHGKATPEDLRRRWRELTEIARACHARAQVAPLPGLDPDVVNVWREVS